MRKRKGQLVAPLALQVVSHPVQEPVHAMPARKERVLQQDKLAAPIVRLENSEMPLQLHAQIVQREASLSPLELPPAPSAQEEPISELLGKRRALIALPGHLVRKALPPALIVQRGLLPPLPLRSALHVQQVRRILLEVQAPARIV